MSRRIHTIEDDYDYQMKECIETFKKFYDLEEVTDDFIWEHVEQFGKIVFENMCECIELKSLGIIEVE